VASSRPRGKGYQVRWCDPDGTERSRQVSTKRTAASLLAEVQRCEDLGTIWHAARPGPPLLEVLDAYGAELGRTKAAATARAEGFTIVLFARFLEEQGHRDPRLSVLSRATLADFWAWLAAGGLKGKRHPETCNKNVQRIYRLWCWAADHDEYEEHTPRPKKPALPSPPKATTVAPRWHEMDACLAHATGWQREAATIMRYTGLRPAQVMALEWAHVDLDALTLRVTTGKSRQEKRGRTIPMSPHLGAYLSGLGRREGFVIVTDREEEKDRAFRPRDLVRAWEASGVRREAWVGQSSKAFRKGLQSELKRSGADDEAVKELVGHSRALRGVYVEADALPLREAVAMIPPVGGDISMATGRTRKRAKAGKRG
jgi:integrase